MRRTNPRPERHVHEHEWEFRGDESAMLYEDGAVFLTEDCIYVEQRSAGYSAKHDETFYETMFECDARRRHRFDLTTIEMVLGDGPQRLAEGREQVLSLYDEQPTLVEEIEVRAAERLTGGSAKDSYPVAHDWGGLTVDTRDHHLTVSYRDQTYRLTYEHVEAVVEER